MGRGEGEGRGGEKEGLVTLNKSLCADVVESLTLCMWPCMWLTARVHKEENVEWQYCVYKRRLPDKMSQGLQWISFAVHVVSRCQNQQQGPLNTELQDVLVQPASPGNHRRSFSEDHLHSAESDCFVDYMYTGKVCFFLSRRESKASPLSILSSAYEAAYVVTATYRCFVTVFCTLSLFQYNANLLQLATELER